MNISTLFITHEVIQTFVQPVEATTRVVCMEINNQWGFGYRCGGDVGAITAISLPPSRRLCLTCAVSFLERWAEIVVVFDAAAVVLMARRFFIVYNTVLPQRFELTRGK